ncbi:catecholate siderophore receptor CirA [bacterium BMS3Bbin03]|nr:catecholate siderophore receptor CirA [bacterium BMS3Bbin03]
MKKLIFYFCLMALFFSGNLYAAGGVVRGRITDSQTGDALPGANILIVGTTMGAASDLKGYYIIQNIPPGVYTLKVSFIGYRTKKLKITVVPGRTIIKNAKLKYGRVLQGKSVIVTAQASGQLSAINEQLTSNTIANVVSKARIKELPDVNAAESIGRLPGVSIERSGGEADKIEIRGLAPKYNTITVNGVRVPATGSSDRSVDLSLISSNMLDGIEVKKAVTPDMDADVLGGTVDLRLKEAPKGLKINTSAQGGYNQLQNYYGNYNFTGSMSNRFFNNRLGIIVNFNIDNYNRSADKFQGKYRRTTKAGTNITQIVPSEIDLREEKVTRGRTGASFVLDYRLPYGKFTANSFYNRLHWDGLYHINRMAVRYNRHYYNLDDKAGSTSIFTGSLGMQQNFGWIHYDLNLSRTASRNEIPNERTWSFVQENAAFQTTRIGPDTPPDQIPSLATIDTSNTGFASAFIYNTKLDENTTAFQLNVKMPFHFGTDISGYIKMGGKFRWLNRRNDQEQNGRDGIQYGGSAGVNSVLASALKFLSTNYPARWNWKNDSTLVRRNGVLPISRVLSSYTRHNFLNGEYPLGFVADQTLMNEIMNAIFATGENRRYSVGSIGRDYHGIERYRAGYLMANLNMTRYLTLISGVRWEGDFSRYSGERYREVSLNNIEGPPADLTYLTNERKNSFWLPMVDLILKPAAWLKIRLDRTETLARPDFIQYAPITSINSYQSYIRAANSTLKPARSTNYDAAVSIYQNYVGLFSVAGFYKNIKDLIFQVSYKILPGVPVLQGLNIPGTWLKGAAPQMDTYINNPYNATYKGVELEWQTHFWYLPSVFRGLVLNVNYTHIFSKIKKELFFNRQDGIIPGSWPPRRRNILVDTLRTARMPDQPANIFNLTLGYDYKGFSARLSYLYQSNKVTFISTMPVLDSFTGAYRRWDLTFRQKIGRGFQIFSNLNNLNGEPDRSYRGAALTNPTYIEYYGFTMDGGLRYNF